MRIFIGSMFVVSMVACTGSNAPDVMSAPDATDIVSELTTIDVADATTVDSIDVRDATPDVFNCTLSNGDGGVHVPSAMGFDTLAEYGLFQGNGASQIPSDGVLPYDVNSSLFADYAHKRRFMYVPQGEHIHFVAGDRWTMPLGSILVKTFSYLNDERDPSLGERLVETRLLVRQCTGFRALTYLWNDAQNEARLSVVSPAVPIHWIDAMGAAQSVNFQPPNLAECGSCHGPGDLNSADPLSPLGIRTGQLNRTFDYGGGHVENEIDHFTALGLFDSAPPATSTLEHFSDPFGSDPVEQRARSYLQANCAHCHSEAGHARDSSGLTLNIEIPDSPALGVCKLPLMIDRSGGLMFDIVPGHADQSILPYRMALTMSASIMPPLGRTRAHTEGVDLINQWINAMPAQTCGM